MAAANIDTEKLIPFDGIADEKTRPANFWQRFNQFFQIWKFRILVIIVVVAVLLGVIFGAVKSKMKLNKYGAPEDNPCGISIDSTVYYSLDNIETQDSSSVSTILETSIRTTESTDSLEYNKQTETTSPLDNTEPLKNSQPMESDVCNTRGCKYAAKFVQQNMDMAIDPCDDFFKFSCGKWISEHILDVEEELLDQLLINLKHRIEYPEKPEDTEAVRDLRNVYNACMNTSVEEDTKQLLKWSLDFGGWPLVMKNCWSKKDFQLEIVLGKLSKDGGFNFFQVEKGGHFFSDAVLDIKISPQSYYFYDETDVQRSIRNAAHIVAEGVEIDDKDLAETAQLAMDLQEIFDSSTFYVEISEVTLLELTTTTQFDWLLFLKQTFNGITNLTIDDTISVDNIELISRIVDLLNTMSPRTTTNYLMWKYISAYSDKLEIPLMETSSRWQYCLNTFDDVALYATGSVYAKYYESVEKKSSVNDLFMDLMISPQSFLKENSWMDKKTSNAALEKAAAMGRIYPLDLLNNTMLNTFYEEFKPSTIHMENIRAISIFMKTVKYRFSEPMWQEDSSTFLGDFANAFYEWTSNEIEILDGFLQPPYFSADNIKAMNYGALGQIIGHEFTHAFDVNGMKYDKYGNPYDWWSTSSLKAYKDRTDCFARQYSEYCWEDFGNYQCVDGNYTLSENIADNGGMQLAIKAYKEWIARNGKERTLPGLSQFTNQQLFFISNAQRWCQSYAPQTTTYSLYPDNHSPAQFRVLGVMSNSKEFSVAFNCSKGSKMNPVSKCKFW